MQYLKTYNEKFKTVSSDEYYNSLENIIDSETFNQIIQGDNMAKYILKKDLNYLNSENGNIFIVYGENNQFIIVVGLIHKERRVKREDLTPTFLADVDELIDELIQKAANGKIIWCFPNQFSERIINKRLQKRAEDLGYEFDIQIDNTYNAPDGNTYKDMKIRITK